MTKEGVQRNAQNHELLIHMVALSSNLKAEMAKIAEPFSTIAGKIRALGDAGYAPADIARFLGRSYQQVRQVLVDERARRERQGAGAAGTGESVVANPPSRRGPASMTSASFRMVVGPDGQLTIPAAVLHRMGAKAGDVVMGRFQGDEFVLLDGRTAMRRAQELVRSFVPEGVSLVDELIAERRREAEQEDEHG
jgi:bifunctional DNA-binding transcriptional regulator/antitoxin component of YhaV-PrlF toxin-antitoxin module